MRPKPTSILLFLPLALCAGCELAGALIAAEVTKDDDIAGSSATLRVAVESASGEVRGRTLAPEMFAATGARFEQELSFDLATADDVFAIQVLVPAESSAENPYGERTPGATVQACDGPDCQLADDFGVEVVQTESGRRAFIDGLWNGTETADITLHFTEE